MHPSLKNRLLNIYRSLWKGIFFHMMAAVFSRGGGLHDFEINLMGLKFLDGDLGG